MADGICPRCEGQKYDVGACGLCGNLGWLCPECASRMTRTPLYVGGRPVYRCIECDHRVVDEAASPGAPRKLIPLRAARARARRLGIADRDEAEQRWLETQDRSGLRWAIRQRLPPAIAANDSEGRKPFLALDFLLSALADAIRERDEARQEVEDLRGYVNILEGR